MSKVIIMIGNGNKGENPTRAIKYCTEERNISKIIKNIPSKANINPDENIVSIRIAVV